MSEFKGTKGEWILEIQNKWPFNIDIDCGEKHILRMSMSHYSTSDKSIKDCLNRDFDSNSECISNAKVIACAPEMLEMLEKIVYECQIRDVSRFKEIKQLIKKATE